MGRYLSAGRALTPTCFSWPDSMFKSAFNYLASAASNAASAAQDEAANAMAAMDDPVVGSRVDVGDERDVAVKKRIGQGGFAFVYEVRQGQKRMALKRLLASDQVRHNLSLWPSR